MGRDFAPRQRASWQEFYNKYDQRDTEGICMIKHGMSLIHW